jgi:hypothetical protein
MTTKDLDRSAKKASKKAVADAFSKGFPITVQQGKRIVKIFPDGREETITNLERAYIKSEKKIFKV